MLKILDDSARGYLCLDCDNSKIFDAESDLYRLYKPVKSGSDEYDFNNEIACHYSMKCYECSSENIGIEVSSDEIIKDHKLTVGHGMWLVGERWLLDVSDSDDLKDLIEIIFESEGEEKSDDMHGAYEDDGFDAWDWENETFSEAEYALVLVNIVSTGIIRQDEYGLGDEDSSYDNAQYIGIY